MSLPAEPIRLAFCITELDPGGAEKALVQLVTRLDRKRWQPHVYCLSQPGMMVDELVQANVPITCFGARHATQMWVVLRLVRELRQLKPALLQTFLFHANIVGRLAGRIARIPKIVSGIRVAEKRHAAPLWIDRITKGLVDHNICVSQAVADFSIARSRLKPHKVSVIPNGVDYERFAQATAADLSEFGIPDNAKTVLFVGRLDIQKNPLKLLESLIPLFDAHAELHALLVGAGELERELHGWVQTRQLSHRVHFAGWQPAIPQLLKAAYCLALPSRWEGMPNVVLEAMAAGLPVVATKVDGTAELVRDGQTGILVDPASTEKFSQALSRLLEDPDTASKMGIASQDVVKTEFTIDSIVSMYENLYSSLLQS